MHPHRATSRIALAVAAALAVAGYAAPAYAASPVTVKDVILNIGSTSAERNVAWLAQGGETVKCAQYAKSSQGFDKATTVHASALGTAYEQPWTYFHATMTDLKPSTTYVYRVGDCATRWSTPYTFRTRDNGSFNFLVYGDPQVYQATATNDPGAGWAKTLSQSTTQFPGTDFLMTEGDQVDAYTPSAQTPQWDIFLAPKQLTQYALAPVVGNHDNANGTSTQWSEHFAVPNETPYGRTVGDNGDYSFVYNNALFMVLNTNSLDVAAHETFMKAAINANKGTAWQIVSFHHAPYSSADHPSDADVTYLRTNLTPVLSKLGVDLVLNGHDHDYARSYLMEGTSIVPGSNGSTVKATDGQTLYIATNSSSGGKFYALTGPYPWTAKTNQENVANYTNVEVNGGKIVVTTYRSTDNSVIDAVTLKNQSV